MMGDNAPEKKQAKVAANEDWLDIESQQREIAPNKPLNCVAIQTRIRDIGPHFKETNEFKCCMQHKRSAQILERFCVTEVELANLES